MISYNVFFSPRPGVEDQRLIAVTHRFLTMLKTGEKLRSYRILRVTDPASFPDLPRFQAIMDFESQREFDDSFTFMRQPGKVSEGPHGELLGLVEDFKVCFTADV